MTIRNACDVNVINNSIKAHFLRKDTYFSIPVMPQLCIKYTHKKEYLHVLYIKMVNNKKFCLNLGTYYSEELETDPQLSVNYEKFKILVDYDEVLYLKKSFGCLGYKRTFTSFLYSFKTGLW